MLSKGAAKTNIGEFKFDLSVIDVSLIVPTCSHLHLQCWLSGLHEAPPGERYIKLHNGNCLQSLTRWQVTHSLVTARPILVAVDYAIPLKDGSRQERCLPYRAAKPWRSAACHVDPQSIWSAETHPFVLCYCFRNYWPYVSTRAESWKAKKAKKAKMLMPTCPFADFFKL